jgi:hypothetical protein
VDYLDNYISIHIKHLGHGINLLPASGTPSASPHDNDRHTLHGTGAMYASGGRRAFALKSRGNPNPPHPFII